MRGHKKLWLSLAFSAFLILFCAGAYMASSQLLREHREEAAFEELIERVEAQGEINYPEIDEPSLDAPGVTQQKFTKYDALWEENHDLFGWVEIEGTKLNYPVMHTPQDPERYLHRAFDGSYAVSGVPFLDGGCFEGCGNYILYGHHMKNGTMFATITDYKSEDFWREHPRIKFDTLTRPGEYEVMAAFYAQVLPEGSEGFKYYEYQDLTEEPSFREYVEGVTAAALYPTGVEAEFGDELLTLSTCSYHQDEGRFVIVAVRVK